MNIGIILHLSLFRRFIGSAGGFIKVALVMMTVFFFLPSYRNLVRFIDFALESYGEKE